MGGFSLWEDMRLEIKMLGEHELGGKACQKTEGVGFLGIDGRVCQNMGGVGSLGLDGRVCQKI